MATTWVITANSEYGRILEAKDATGPLEELETLVSATARLHEQDMVSDRPGRSYDSVGGGRHAMDPGEDAKHTEAKRFSKEIAVTIDAALEKKRFDRLVLVAPPAFLGLLRESIGDGAAKLVTHEIDKNIVRLDLKSLREHLPDRI